MACHGGGAAAGGIRVVADTGHCGNDAGAQPKRKIRRAVGWQCAVQVTRQHAGGPAMGYIGTHIAPGAVFYVSALFGGMALGCLLMISGVDIMNAPHRTSHPTAWPKHARKEPLRRRRDLWRDPLLLTFAACAFMFQLSNDAVLPFAVAAIQVVGLKDTDTLVSDRTGGVAGGGCTDRATAGWIGSGAWAQAGSTGRLCGTGGALPGAGDQRKRGLDRSLPGAGRDQRVDGRGYGAIGRR